MISQLLSLAEDHLHGIGHGNPDLVDIDSKEVTSVTADSIVQTIMQQARKGNVLALREMLSGSDTASDHSVVTKLQGPITTQLQNRLNISESAAKQLATQSLPIILNMLNVKVKSAQHSGLNIHDALGALSANSGGFLKGITGMLGGNTKSNKTINSIFQNLIG